MLGKPYNESADVFSFSMIMHEILHDALYPFGITSFVEVRMATEPHFRPVIAPRFEQDTSLTWYITLMCACWNADPMQRPTFSDMLTQFSNYAESL